MKFKTIREGQQAVVFNHLGEGRLIVGPSRVFLFRERLQKLKHYTATQHQYLIFKDKMGVVTHKRGVTIKEAIRVDANHLIVVYKRLKDNDVQRRIIQGPTVFVPEAEEWMHEFKWHGSDPSNKTRMIPASSVFKHLAIIPDQFYYNVRDVRTVDDTMITVNAVCADIIAFAGKITFDDFLKNTHKLNDLSTYPQLLQRVDRVGYTIQKVVFRGYHATDQLQAMQNNAIESRTQLRLNAEIEEKRQQLTDFKLTKEQQRTKLKQDMERGRQEHRQKMSQLKQNHQLEIQDLEHQQKLQMQTLLAEARLEHKTAENEHDVEFLKNLKALSVDLTKYLTCQQNPPISEEIQVLSNSAKQHNLFKLMHISTNQYLYFTVVTLLLFSLEIGINLQFEFTCPVPGNHNLHESSKNKHQENY
ncbi:hypothetical protein KUTeg_006495 [Tegillarca granosa]|uniref:Band 7 domain-containing protein n=1 Tax=Tegillarca granosa TaxID=220873 RepID=A0ABQ9FJZ2_TEGGR|nr:hypothetical protein KUTeg_006495 [Tegillarca granosa]